MHLWNATNCDYWFSRAIPFTIFSLAVAQGHKELGAWSLTALLDRKLETSTLFYEESQKLIPSNAWLRYPHVTLRACRSLKRAAGRTMQEKIPLNTCIDTIHTDYAALVLDTTPITSTRRYSYCPLSQKDNLHNVAGYRSMTSTV